MHEKNEKRPLVSCYSVGLHACIYLLGTMRACRRSGERACQNTVERERSAEREMALSGNGAQSGLNWALIGR